ncbi:hypothetical protein NPIL_329121 [Nephila pilipes]|uniref:Uncharacterized protein n=1 Tax=Nephila pilipes TaxID=299642 RepID=A0A8X6QCJ1_NEPPI|nr:hypothetical protein NPIL_329121 [Nephila pilipes]
MRLQRRNRYKVVRCAAGSGAASVQVVMAAGNQRRRGMGWSQQRRRWCSTKTKPQTTRPQEGRDAAQLATAFARVRVETALRCRSGAPARTDRATPEKYRHGKGSGEPLRIEDMATSEAEERKTHSRRGVSV